MITEQNVHLLETSQLFLEIHQDSGTCNYYFADHGLRTIFWLHTIDTIGVRLPLSFSSAHLRMFLKDQSTLPGSPNFVSRIFFRGKLLDPCWAVPRDCFPIFCDCLERTSSHLFACSRRYGMKTFFSLTPGGDRHHSDGLTSETPTFPYTANQCQDFIDILQRSKGMFHLAHLVWQAIDRFFRPCFQPLHHYLHCEVMGDRRQVFYSYEP